MPSPIRWGLGNRVGRPNCIPVTQGRGNGSVKGGGDQEATGALGRPEKTCLRCSTAGLPSTAELLTDGQHRRRVPITDIRRLSSDRADACFTITRAKAIKSPVPVEIGWFIELRCWSVDEALWTMAALVKRAITPPAVPHGYRRRAAGRSGTIRVGQKRVTPATRFRRKRSSDDLIRTSASNRDRALSLRQQAGSRRD